MNEYSQFSAALVVVKVCVSPATLENDSPFRNNSMVTSSGRLPAISLKSSQIFNPLMIVCLSSGAVFLITTVVLPSVSVFTS